MLCVKIHFSAVLSHLPFLIEKWNEYKLFKSGMSQLVLGVLKYQTFDQKIKSTHPTKMPLSVASSIQLFICSIVSFFWLYVYSSVQCGVNEIQLARWKISRKFLSCVLFSEVHLLFDFHERKLQASFEDRMWYLRL